MAEFQGWPKIARLSREIIVTEKIDGTNAAILIEQGREVTELPQGVSQVKLGDSILWIRAQSRTRYISPVDDNFGFAAWVKENAEELIKLGPGRHFGEWWGSGIQRGYAQPKGCKRFSLFNTGLWHSPDQTLRGSDKTQPCPSCCGVVPVLYRGPMDTVQIDKTLAQLAQSGSVAAPGFMDPEGIIVYHTAGGHYYKKTLSKDEQPKGVTNG